MLPLYIGFAALLLAGIFFLIAYLQRSASGLPAGRVTYSDTGAWGKVEKPFFDPGLKLTGKPDYIVKQADGVIPVEVKTGPAPKAPYDSHAFQLAAYCFLVEHATGKRPGHGIIHYQDRDFVIDYTPQRERDLLHVIRDVRNSELQMDVPRSHNVKQRCLACGFRQVCDQRLA